MASMGETVSSIVFPMAAECLSKKRLNAHGYQLFFVGKYFIERAFGYSNLFRHIIHGERLEAIKKE